MPGAGGRGIGPAGGAHQTAHGLANNVVARPLGVGAVVAEAGHAAVDDGGVHLAQFFIAQAQLVHDAGTVILQHDVALLHQLQEDLLAFLALQVQGHAVLIPVQVHEVGALAVDDGGVATGIVSPSGQFDLDDVGSHVCQHHAAVGTSQHSGEVQYFYST